MTRGSTIASNEGSVNINVGTGNNESNKLENEASQLASRRENGTFKNTASDIFAEKNININAENIEISDGVHQSWNEHESLGLNFELPARVSLDYTNTEYTTTTQRSSNLIANGNINITAGNGLSITGSNLIAGEDMNLDAQNINIQNGEYVDQMTQYGFSNSMGIGGTDWRPSASNTIWHSEGRQERLTPSNLVSGNNLKIEAENLNIEASNLAAENKIDINANKLNIRGDWQDAQTNTNFISLGGAINYGPSVSITLSGGNTNAESGQYVFSSLTAPSIEINAAERNLEGVNRNGSIINGPNQTSYSNSETTVASVGVTIGPGFFMPSTALTHTENGQGFAIGVSGSGVFGGYINGDWMLGGSLGAPTESTSATISPFISNSRFGTTFSTTFGLTEGTSSHLTIAPSVNVLGVFNGGFAV